MKKTASNPISYAAFTGLDWSTKELAFSVFDPLTETRYSKTIPNKPEPLLEFLAELRNRFQNKFILLGLEATRASILPILLQHDFLRILLINPKVASDFRRMFRISGAKSDPTDAHYLCELIRTHHHEFRLWEPHDPLTRQLAACVQQRRELVALRVDIANRLHGALQASFPQLLELLHCQLTLPIASHFLQRWPTLESAQGVGIEKLRAFFYKNNMRATTKLQQRLESFMKAKPLLLCHEDRQPVRLFVTALANQLEQLHRSIKTYDHEIEELFHKHPNAKLFADLPGAGDQLKPRLAVAFGTQKNRFQSCDEVGAYTGIAPVIQSSGKTSVTSARWIRPIFLHQTWIEFANCSTRRSVWAKEFYNFKRESGKSHFQAIRTLGYKWIRVLYACWIANEPYDETRYLATLERKSPQLWKRIQERGKVKDRKPVNN